MSEIKHRIAVIGPKETVSGFQALGADVFTVTNGGQARDVISELRSDSSNSSTYGVIMITGSVLRDIPADDYAKISRGALPAILAIPDISGADSQSIEKLKKLTERAIGSDILS